MRILIRNCKVFYILTKQITCPLSLNPYPHVSGKEFGFNLHSLAYIFLEKKTHLAGYCQQPSTLFIVRFVSCLFLAKTLIVTSVDCNVVVKTELNF